MQQELFAFPVNLEAQAKADLAHALDDAYELQKKLISLPDAEPYVHIKQLGRSLVGALDTIEWSHRKAA